ncbi:hypothetical protein ACG0Z4_01615 [Enterocloster aldenensis]|uniref:hypothetical protein n=1 Tax=Enterocloster aldenensis TaxID=358742 RepID=UPI001A9ABCDB
MKNRSWSVAILSVILSAVVLAGCSANPAGNEGVSRTAVMQETTTGQDMTSEIVQEDVQEEKDSPGYEDNFTVDGEAVKQFAEKIKKATADKDIVALAELTAFPVYVGLPDAGVVETKEDFIAIGADVLFTDELVASVGAADIENFQPSMAGFSVAGSENANINFGVADGVLAINGINY